jgi:transposase
MTIEEIDVLLLQPIRVRSNGKRDYDPAAKQRLVQMCLSSGASVSSMALKAGINANQLR